MFWFFFKMNKVTLFYFAPLGIFAFITKVNEQLIEIHTMGFVAAFKFTRYRQAVSGVSLAVSEHP